MSSQRGTASLWDENIRTVCVTVHNTGAHQHSERSENHATQYYLLSASRSVQLNMKTEPGFINGVYTIEPESYHHSSSEICHFDYDAAASFTSRMVDQLLNSSKFNDYTFTNGGIGCRYWKSVTQIPPACMSFAEFSSIPVVYVLESKGYVANGSAFDLLFQLPHEFSTRCQPSEWRIMQGTFDHPQTQQIAITVWEKFQQSISQRKAESEYTTPAQSREGEEGEEEEEEEGEEGDDDDDDDDD